MSRLAKKPILFPAGVTCTLDGTKVTINGQKGTLSYILPPTVSGTLDGNSLLLASSAVERKDHAQWGLSWALIRQKITGVSEGYKKTLQLQ